MTFLKQNWLKIAVSIVCWILSVWGIFVVTATLGSGNFGALKDWSFYVFGIFPIFALILVRHQINKVLIWLWSVVPSRKWFSKNWFKLAGIILIIFAITQYFNYLDKKSTLVEEQSKREYIAKRKTDCLAIYKTESDKWNNVRGWQYNEPSDSRFSFNADTCEIIYKDNKTGEDFSKYY